MPSTTHYQSSYQLIYPWVAPDPKCDTNSFCTLCSKAINLARMGVCAIKSHSTCQNHRHKVASLKNSVPLETFVHSSVKDDAIKDANLSSIAGTSGTSGTNTNTNELQLTTYQGIESPTRVDKTGKRAAMAKYLLTEEKTKAEIMMCLLLIDAHMSIRATAKCVKLFPRMFSDSEIAAAQRHIYDAIQDAGGIEEVEIDKSLIHSMRNAHSLYKSDLDERKKEADKENQEKESKKRKQAEIKQLESKRAKMLAEAAQLSSEIEQLRD